MSDMLFSYARYTATFADWHKKTVQEYFRKIDENGYIYETTEEQDYCETCGQFLSDREIEGTCPVCGKRTRGDQCEHCMASFDSSALTDKICRTCGGVPSKRINRHLMFALSRFQSRIEEFAAKNAPNWRWNAVNETKKYLEQGLPDRAATRDLTWGIEVPREGYENKRIYVWIEAVLGYMTTGKWVAEQRGIDFDEFMKDDGNLNAYYVHGKDNIPFHTVIFPALEMAINPAWSLPTHIVSSEYINMKNEKTSEEEKMSKSVGNIVSVHELAELYPADAIRFYMILNNPERRDTAFSKADLVQNANKVLAGGFGNFVNRNLSFIKKKFGGVVPAGKVDRAVREYMDSMYEKDLTAFGNTTATCLYLMANMANLFAPIIPQGCEKLTGILGTPAPVWREVTLPETFEIGDVEILYSRIE